MPCVRRPLGHCGRSATDLGRLSTLRATSRAGVISPRCRATIDLEVADAAVQPFRRGVNVMFSAGLKDPFLVGNAIRPLPGRWSLSVLVVAIVVGCSGCASSDGSPAASTPSTSMLITPPASSVVTAATQVESTAVLPVIDAADGDPLVTFGIRPYGLTDYWRPLDLQQIYLYPDGRVIEVVLDGTYDDELRPLLLRQFDVDDDEVVRVAALAQTAGLIGGGMQPLLPLPEGAQVEDGAQFMFSAKLDGLQTARAVDQLEVSPEWDEGARGDFAALMRAMRSLIDDTATGDPGIPVRRWVIASAPLRQAETDDEPAAWTGPDLATVEWTKPSGGAWCSIVDVDDWPIARREREDWKLVIDQRQITRRPLLPHESGCDDVEVWRDLLQA
jgi:hypothetical protein